MKKCLAYLLTLVMLLSCVPTTLAEETAAEEPAAVAEVEEPIEEPAEEETEEEPTAEPTAVPTAKPTVEPTAEPTAVPTVEPTAETTATATIEPTAEPTPEIERVVSVSITAEPVADDGTAEITATVEMNFEAEVVYDWQTIAVEDYADPEIEWTSLDEHEDTLKLTDLTMEYCSSVLYRCRVTADDITAVSEELMLEAGQFEENVMAVANAASDFEYSISNNECTITGYTGSATEVVIPDTIADAKVTKIGDDAFHECSSMTSITIPDSVTSIGNEAFCDCYNLTSISIPDEVTSIGAYAFDFCSSLTSIVIPNSITEIGDGAFWYCSSLTSITISDSVTSISDDTFYGCSSLISIIIPDSVTRIGTRAFYECVELKSVKLSSNLEELGYNSSGAEGVFENCQGQGNLYDQRHEGRGQEYQAVLR